MVDGKGKSVVAYFLRLISGLAVIVGALMVFSALARGDLFGVVLGVVLIIGGVVVLKRPGRTRKAE
jgi:hypothetical protein